jgi:hypothetical protein
VESDRKAKRKMTDWRVEVNPDAFGSFLIKLGEMFSSKPGNLGGRDAEIDPAPDGYIVKMY